VKLKTFSFTLLGILALGMAWVFVARIAEERRLEEGPIETGRHYCPDTEPIIEKCEPIIKTVTTTEMVAVPEYYDDPSDNLLLESCKADTERLNTELQGKTAEVENLIFNLKLCQE